MVFLKPLKGILLTKYLKNSIIKDLKVHHLHFVWSQVNIIPEADLPSLLLQDWKPERASNHWASHSVPFEVNMSFAIGLKIVAEILTPCREIVGF